MTFQSNSLLFPKTACALILLVAGAGQLVSQTLTESQFITSVTAAIAKLPANSVATHPVVFSGNLVLADGKAVGKASPVTLLAYVDGLKAAGAQRIDLNPGLTTVTNATTRALYDATIRHIRELGMQVAINPEFTPGELGSSVTFQEFQSTAEQNYTELASRYQPDIFVIVHEPTTLEGSMGGVVVTTQEWHNFLLDLGPRIKAVSPHTRLGAGGFQNGALANLSQQEKAFWEDAVTIPTCSASTVTTGCLDVMTMDIYNDDTFDVYNQYIQLATQNNKGISIAETWAPHYLPVPLPASAFSSKGFLTKSLDQLALIGVANPDFAAMDAQWLQGMANWASANGLEAVTAFTTQCFFATGSSGADHIDSPAFSAAVQGALDQGHITSTGQAFLATVKRVGIKEMTSISSASYATLPSNFTPNCGSSTNPNPCNANTTVAADELVSGFGADLATTSLLDGTFPTNLGGTTMTLVDSSNTTYNVQLYFVATGQVNYYVPAKAKPGPATLTVKSADGTESTGVILIAAAMPGLYAANANGKGAAAAIAIIVHADGTRSTPYTFTCPASGSCVPQSLNLVSTDQLYIELFGTGMRHQPSGLTATVNGQNVPVQFAGASSYTGEDQVNIQIPSSLYGSGTVNVVLTVQNPADQSTMTSNTVTIAL